MDYRFVETIDFSKWLLKHFTPELYAKLIQEIIEDPNRGTVMPGCGGLRKIRVPDPHRQKGKRGGGRVIYLHIPEVGRFILVDGYGKNEKDDLTPKEKQKLRASTIALKRHIVATVKAQEELER